MDAAAVTDPIQSALAGVFKQLQEMGGQAPTPATAGQALPVTPEAPLMAESPLPRAPLDRDPFVKPPESIAADAARPPVPAAPAQGLEPTMPTPASTGMTRAEFDAEYPDISRLIQNIPGARLNLPRGYITDAPISPAPATEAGASPEVATAEAAAAAAPKDAGEVDDAKVESELSKYFDVNVEDIVPKELLDELKKQAMGGMQLHDAIGIAGIAITNPQLASQLLLDMSRQKNAATNELVNLSAQVGSFKKEGGRQLALYMRSRADQRAMQSRIDERADNSEYLLRSEQSAEFLSELRKTGIDPTEAGVPPLSEQILRDPVKFGDWVQIATTSASRGAGKQQLLAELSGMKANGPATLAAKTGADPTAAVTMLLQKQGFTPEELAGLQPTIATFAKVAQQASQGIDQNRLRAEASMKWMQAMADKNTAQMNAISAEVKGNPGMKRDKAVALMNATMMLQMTAQTEATNVQMLLAAELKKVPPAEASTGFLGIGATPPSGVQDPAWIEGLQNRLESATMMIAESNDALAMLYPIVQGTGTSDVSSLLMDIGPKLAESSRVATLGGKIKPPGVPPPVIAEAMSAAADPATWLAYLKQPPIGADGQPNPYRTAYWASVVRQMGAALGGLQDPEDIIRLLDAQSAGQPSYADAFAGQDITLPEQPISAMAGSLQGGGAPPPPNSPAGGSQQKPAP